MAAEGMVSTACPQTPLEDISPDLLSALLRLAPVMVIWADADGRVHLVNDHTSRITGWPPQDLATAALETLLPDPLARAAFWNAVQTAETGWLDIELTCADGGLMASSWNGQRLGDGSLMAVGVDMRRQVALRTALLDNVEQLQRVNQELEAFIRSASHDLREPVRSLISFSQLLERRLAGTTDREVLDYLGFIVINARRLIDLVNALKSYATAGDLIPLHPVDLTLAAQVADQVLTELRRETEGRVTIHPLPTVCGDAPLLQELLQNLLDNALRHHMPGLPPEVVIVPYVAEDGWHGVAVIDNGMGVPDSILRRGPVPFERFSAPTVTAGLGMGLTISARIAERHGARLWFERRPEGGTRAVVVFPPAADPAEAPPSS